VEPEQLAERVWPGQQVSIEPLGGGITNRNFKVGAGGQEFVLRIGGTDTGLLGIDRAAEHAASRIAAELGLGPEVVAFLEPEGYLVTRFVDGEVGKVDVERVGAALRLLHDGPALPGRFDSFRIVETYRVTAHEHGVAVPSAYDAAKKLADRIEQRRSGASLRP
jgi:aminoglycoside phosphotransferase (APT) family kinase protein